MIACMTVTQDQKQEGTNGREVLEAESNEHGCDMIGVYEYPFNTMSQDWSAEDVKGFYYHEIKDECKAAGGTFPVIAQVYTYCICQDYGVDYEMVFALIERESKCIWNAEGNDGETKGYMQIAEKWHEDRMERVGCSDMLNPFQNIRVGVDFLAELQDKLKNVPEKDRNYYVLAAYNYGMQGAPDAPVEQRDCEIRLQRRDHEPGGAAEGRNKESEGRTMTNRPEKNIRSRVRIVKYEPITEAEEYTKRVILDELKAENIKEGSGEWNIFMQKAEEIRKAHWLEIRDIYHTSKVFLREWIIKELGIKNHKAFKTMLRIGLTGNVMKDMEIMGMKVL